MQNAAGDGTSAQSVGLNHSYRSIVSDLVSLIGRVQASMKLIETAIAGESPLGNQEIAANIVVLDDVSPRYAEAHAALEASNARLGAALNFLQDGGTSKHRTTGWEENARRPARSVRRA